MATVRGSPRPQMTPASDGPAPPRRPGTPAPPSSSTRTPRDCSSTSSRRSSRSRTRSATARVELLVVAPEHALLELLGDVPNAVDLPELAVEVRQRLVGAEGPPGAAAPGRLDPRGRHA